MKTHYYIYNTLFTLLALGAGWMSCSEIEDFDTLTPEQYQLIGKGVNFDASISDPFITRASSYDLTGGFNEGDMLTIYRQYWVEDEGFGEEAYRQYSLIQKRAQGTDIAIGDPNWKPAKDWKGGEWNKETKKTVQFTQTDADSLTWDNDRTLRFRAIGRNNYAGCITGGRDSYYPDFTISDWVTVSGPTTEVPFTMKHLGSRIVFSPRTGNYIQKVEISFSKEDYEWEDNSVSIDNDNSDKFPKEVDGVLITAEQAANNVKAIYEKMCMPSGVDMETGLLKAMTTKFYTTASTNDFTHIVEKPTLASGVSVTAETTDMIQYGTQSGADIAQYIQHPVFSQRLYGSNLFLVTIPYDMSKESGGDPIVLPSYTRFRVWMYDVNNGDGQTTNSQNGSAVSSVEGNYHILSLEDFGDAFKNGLEMTAGRSYRFFVGYQYDQLKAEVAPQFSWKEQDINIQDPAVDETTEPELSSQPYKWWQDAIATAIYNVQNPPQGQTKVDYNPVFEINNEKQFLEFINLVNGTAATNGTRELYQAHRTILKPDGTVQEAGYWWYTGIAQNGDTLWTTEEIQKHNGFVFYQEYRRSVGDNRAEAIPAYLKESFSFYDKSFNKHFTVKLNKDLDMAEWKLASIGNADLSAFQGVFDGQNHSIKNLYMENEYLFGNIKGADVRNLKLESDHNLALVDKATLDNYIAGISIKANCTKSSIANSIIGWDATAERENISYIVGCIHEGLSGDGMIGKADNLYMYGCMEAGEGIPSSKGALLGVYNNPNDPFFATQPGSFPDWGRFMCNYYDIEKSPGTKATSVNEVYKAQEYIRGAKSHVLKATQDYLLSGDLLYSKLSDIQKQEIYGLAPWKAMNYGIYKYNESTVGQAHPCTLHYENNTVGYANRYPVLVSGELNSSLYGDVLDQLN